MTSYFSDGNVSVDLLLVLVLDWSFSSKAMPACSAHGPIRVLYSVIVCQYMYREYYSHVDLQCHDAIVAAVKCLTVHLLV